MNFQLHYHWVHEFLCVCCYEYIQKFGEEYPAIYVFAVTGIQ